MTRRDIKKNLMKFVRREVKEKGADWGELRQVKKHILVKKGLPNVPNLVIQTNEGLSFVVLIHWKKELRLYLFDIIGGMIHGQSYFSSFKEISKDIYSKSKKIARYPALEKKMTPAQQNYKLDKQFRQVWVQLSKVFKISKAHRRNRPLVKGINKETDGIFGTNLDNNFIYIPYDSSKLGAIFHYYTLYFFLPSSIQKNKELTEAIALLLLSSFKSYKEETLTVNRASVDILKKLKPWKPLTALMIFNFLKKVSYYYDSPWETLDFVQLTKLALKYIKKPSRENLPIIFCQLYSYCHNKKFLLLANILGFPFDIDCIIPEDISDNEIVLLLSRIKNWEISKIISYIQQNEAKLTNGQLRAIKEALNYQYSNVLEIELITEKLIDFTNRSDLLIILSSVIQILTDGSEKELVFHEIIIQSQSKISFDLSTLETIDQSPIKIQYSIMKLEKDISLPIFTGTIIL